MSADLDKLGFLRTTVIPNEHMVHYLHFYCNSVSTRKAVAMFAEVLSHRIQLTGITQKGVRPEWAQMVTLVTTDRRDGESCSLTIATQAQLARIQECPLFTVVESSVDMVRGFTPLKIIDKVDDLKFFKYGHKDMIIVPDEANGIIEAVARVLFTL